MREIAVLRVSTLSASNSFVIACVGICQCNSPSAIHLPSFVFLVFSCILGYATLACMAGMEPFDPVRGGFEMGRKSMEKNREFSKRMATILNCGALNLAMAIGYRTRLFDVMDGFEGPQTASVIAEAAELNDRYVREWLGVMVTGGIVELSRSASGDDLFHLPREHGDLITRRAGNSNLGVYTQEIPLLTACAIDPVLEGFRTGGGVPYGHYPKFYEFMAELASAKHRAVLVEKFLPSVLGGQLIKRLKRGIRVCDVGCAEGVAVMLMAEAFPSSTFVGMDISEGSIVKARIEASNKGLENVSFLNLDAAFLQGAEDLLNSFDYVTAFDAIHDQTRPLDALINVHSLLKQGGLFSMVDIAASSSLAGNRNHPMGPFLYAVSLMHCMPVGLVDNGAGLGMMWGREAAVEMLNQAGFGTVQVLAIPEDPFNVHFLCKKTS
jgi:ubiquinone/menaquinone biosynthesis C-methylase UbiE